MRGPIAFANIFSPLSGEVRELRHETKIEGRAMNPQKMKSRHWVKGLKSTRRWKKNRKLVRGSNPR